MTTVAGGGCAGCTNSGSADGAGSAAMFAGDQSIVLDAVGSVAYIADKYNNRIRALALASGAVTTLAGSTRGYADGAGTSAKFFLPDSVSLAAATSTLYVSDEQNCVIRALVVSTGGVTTLAGTPGVQGYADGAATVARFNQQTGVAVDATQSNVFVADQANNAVRVVAIATGDVSTLAGGGFGGYADGIGSAARFAQPWALAVSGGTLFVSDRSNSLIRAVDVASRIVTTLAGGGGGTLSGYLDAVGTNALFAGPPAIAADARGRVYIGDYNNLIRVIDATTRAVSTLAGGGSAGGVGSGAADGAGSAATFRLPHGIAATAAGDVLVIADYDNNLVRRIAVITCTSVSASSSLTLSLSRSASWSPSAAASRSVAASPSVSESCSSSSAASLSASRSASQSASQSASRSVSPASPSVTGSRTESASVTPSLSPCVPATVVSTLATTGAFGIAYDGAGRVYIGTGGALVRVLDTLTGIVTTLAGSSPGCADGVGTSALFQHTSGVAVATSAPGTVFVADAYNHRIRAVDVASAGVSTIAGGGGGNAAGSSNGIGTVALFSTPYQVAAEASGARLFVTENAGGAANAGGVRVIVTATAAVTTLATGFTDLLGVAVDSAAANVFVASRGLGALYAIAVASSAVSTLATGLSGPNGLAMGATDKVLVANNHLGNIVSISISSGAASTLAGVVPAGFTDGLATAAKFSYPYGVAVDGSSGSVFVGDSGNNLVRRIALTCQSPSGSPSVTATRSASVSGSASRAASISRSASGSASASRAESPSSSPTRTIANSASVTPSETPSRSRSIATSASATPSVTPSRTGSVVASASVIISLTTSPSVSASVTGTVVLSTTLTSSVSPSGTGSLSASVSGTRSVSPASPSVTASRTASGSATPSLTPCVPAAVVTTLAGGGGAGGTASGNANGVGSTATFFRPFSVAADGAGVVYVADASNNLVRIIAVATGLTSTLAGGGSAGGAASGRSNAFGSAATFTNNQGVAVDGTGNVYVADTVNHLIRAVVAATGAVTTLAGGGSAGGVGSGFANGAGSAATFYWPTAVAVNSTGCLLVADASNNLIRAIIVTSGAVTTVAGGGSTGGVATGAADGVGSAATFSYPRGIAVDGAGNAYVGDTDNHRVRAVVVSTGAVRTLAGGGSAGGVGSGFANGAGSAATFRSPSGVAVCGAGVVYVADYGNNLIRAIVISTGAVTTVAGGGSMTGGGRQRPRRRHRQRGDIRLPARRRRRRRRQHICCRPRQQPRPPHHPHLPVTQPLALGCSVAQRERDALGVA